MALPWQTLDGVETPEGRLELRRRGEHEFLITVGGRVLMNGATHRTERALAELACGPLARRSAPRVLVGGLGMGYTLRAALDVLPAAAEVVVAEINPAVVRWCQGPLAPLTDNAVGDRRSRLELRDVAAIIADAARRGGAHRFDAILLDLYEGPRQATQGREDPLYGRRALERSREALLPSGVFAVWSEDADPHFERQLSRADFALERRRPGRGGPRHLIYLARPQGARRNGKPGAPPRPRPRRGR